MTNFRGHRLTSLHRRTWYFVLSVAVTGCGDTSEFTSNSVADDRTVAPSTQESSGAGSPAQSGDQTERDRPLPNTLPSKDLPSSKKALRQSDAVANAGPSKTQALGSEVPRAPAPSKALGPFEEPENKSSTESSKESSPNAEACRVDLAARFANFTLKGGQSLPISNTFPEYPGVAASVNFETSSPVQYMGGSFSVAPGIVATGKAAFGVTLPGIPQCQGNFTITLLPDQSFVTPIASQRGLKGALYRLALGTQSLPDFAQLTAEGEVFISELNVPQRVFTDGFPGVAGDLTEWFAINFTGHLVIEKSGTYSFMLFSDDGSKLYLNHSLLIDHDGIHGPSPASSAPIPIEAGVHPLRIPYFQGPRDAIALQLFFKGPDNPEWTIVPQSMLRVNP